jgi:Flp pilus assembly protein TadD
MRWPKRNRVLRVALAVVILGAVGAAWRYPAWRSARDYRAAEEAFARFDLPAARDRLARCEARRPNDPGVQLLACRAARRAGDLAGAEGHLSRYRQLAGKTHEVSLEEAMLKVQRGHTADAVDFLMYQLDAQNPRSEEILESLAMGCVQTYNLDRATFWIDELLARNPKNPIGRLLKAQTISTIRLPDDAIELLRPLVREFPLYVAARLSLGALLLTTDQASEAAEAFREVRRIEPGNTIALLGYSRALLRLGRADELRALVPELEGHADSSEALLRCGQFATSEQRWADAEGYLTRAARLSPSDHEIRKGLAVCLFQLGRPDEARPHSERAAQIEADLRRLEKLVDAMLRSPRDPNLRVEAGQICLRNNQTAEGLRWLAGALEIAPKHKPAHRALADFYARQGDSQLASYHRDLAH